MLGFERFGAAAVTIGCIEFAEKMYKDRFNIGKLAGRPSRHSGDLAGCIGGLRHGKLITRQTALDLNFAREPADTSLVLVGVFDTFGVHGTLGGFLIRKRVTQPI